MEKNLSPDEVSPLGLGHDPVKDPLKSFNGMVIANSLTMELIVLGLTLPMLRMLYQGSLWTGVNIGIIAAFIVFHIGMFAFMKKPWALTAILLAQAAGIGAGLFIHWSITAVFVIFGLLWLLALYLRSVLVERMKRGYLTTQHLESKS